jgi:YD repeat-containing protein
LAYDAADRLTTITDKSGAFTSLDAQSYTSNAASEVSSETNAEGTVSYIYDSNGNRTMTGYTTGPDDELTASPGYT